MNLVSYFTFRHRLPVYAAASTLFSVAVALLAHSFNTGTVLPLAFIVLVLSYIMRATDDLHDYAKDRRSHKKQLISRDQLIALCIFLTLVFVILNCCLYGIMGVISLLLLGIILIWEIFPVCKILFLPLTCIAYVLLTGGTQSLTQYALWLGSIALLFASCSYYAFKKGNK